LWAFDELCTKNFDNLVGLSAVDYVIVMLAFHNQTKGAAPNDAAPLVSADRTR
jgi:hypothetical protein